MLTAEEMSQERIIEDYDIPTPATFYGHKRMASEGVPGVFRRRSPMRSLMR